MSSIFKHVNKNKIIYIIVFLFLVIKLSTISIYRLIWWDSAVYIGMGKYIYSLGNAGLWEESRPVVWPLMLGLLWKVGFNVVLVGRIIEIIFGSLCILLTYLIGKKLFNKKIALLSSIFLALSPTFFFFNGVMLTEIISTFFSLVAVYLFIKKRHFISGMFLGIAFMTRFLQLFILAALLFVIICFDKKDKKNIRNLQKIIIGFIITIAPFLILNQILYNNALFPFLQQIFLSKNSGWLNYHPLSYYFIELLKENFIYLVSIFGILLIFKKKDKKKIPISLAFFLFFLFFSSIKQKEMRFLIVLFPYMYLLVSFSIICIFNNYKNKTIKVIFILFVVLSFLLSLNTMFTYYKNEFEKNNQYAAIQGKLEKIAQGKIWVSNPIIPVFSDKKIDKLMYYPLFNEEKKKELIKEAKNVDFIFLDSCDLACNPSDTKCKNDKNELLIYFKQQFKAISSLKINSRMRVSDANSLTSHCEQFIFSE